MSIYSVGQVNTYIKNMFTQDILLSRLSVRGEVSNIKYHTSGHIYFTLKDESGTIPAVMFAGNKKKLTFRIENGMKIIVTGSISVYERDGRYQIYVSDVRQDGEGDLFQRFQKLKEELSQMGMFSDEYKKPVKRYARTIGIVTASTGAAVRDIMNIAQRRNPYVGLILYPAIVQGENAAQSIVQGIRCLDKYGVDTIIVGRGGGSIEDLWAFNEESVARAIFECNTPVISAVGHETDYTIADFVADLRAPTPSAAAELAVFDINDFYKDLKHYADRLNFYMNMYVADARNRINHYVNSLGFLNPVNMYNSKRQQVMDYEEKLNSLMKLILLGKRHDFKLLCERLKGVSPLNKMSMGYAFVEAADNKPVKSIKELKKDGLITVNLSDGKAKARIVDIDPKISVIGGMYGKAD